MNSPPPPELLSPAGGPEAGYAALAYGADAVYLGLKTFSARAEAVNFTLEEVDAFTAYAHALAPRRRVFVALNTLVLGAEIRDLLATLVALRDTGVDAVIVQDLGLARVLRHHVPTLSVHASTQMAVHSRRGVEALARLGVRRVVAARELTLAELHDLCDQPDVEIECFVHGAACYSYSGLCLFSSHALGRSANRGRCAYACGGSFSPIGGRTGGPALPFAMKDLALSDRLADLTRVGVASFKVEGRKKSPLYVAAVTALYRGLLDGTLGEAERRRREDDLRTIFSRPWTELYLSSHRQNACGDPRSVGHRGTPVGTVAAVHGERRRGSRLRFTTTRALEVHDGLQIEIPGLVRPYGFAIGELRVSGSAAPRFEAVAGSEVEVALPPDHPVIPLGTAVHCTSSQAVKRAFRWLTPRDGEFRHRQPVDVEAHVTPERVALRARLPSGTETAQVLDGPLPPAREPEAGARGARAAFERLGSTPFALAGLVVVNEPPCYVAPSQWNRLRRATTDALERAVTEAREADVGRIADTLSQETVAPSPTVPAERQWSIKTDRLDRLDAFAAEDWAAASEVVVCLGRRADGRTAELAALAGRIGRERVRLALPPVMRPWDEREILPQVARLRAEGWRHWEIANLAGWGHLGISPGESPGDLDLTSDWPLYVLNPSAGHELLELGVSRFALSPEDGAENLKRLLRVFGGRAMVVICQHTPLFLSETCPHATLSGGCPGSDRCRFESLDLVSDFGDRVRALRCDCRTVVVSRSPFCLSEALGELSDAGATSFRVDLQYSDRTPEAIREAWRRVRDGQDVGGGHRGNYDRGLR